MTTTPEQHRRYNRSEKGRERYRRYNETERGKLRDRLHEFSRYRDRRK